MGVMHRGKLGVKAAAARDRQVGLQPSRKAAEDVVLSCHGVNPWEDLLSKPVARTRPLIAPWWQSQGQGIPGLVPSLASCEPAASPSAGATSSARATASARPPPQSSRGSNTHRARSPRLTRPTVPGTPSRLPATDPAISSPYANENDPSITRKKGQRPPPTESLKMRKLRMDQERQEQGRASPLCSRSSSTPPTRPPGPLVRAGSGLLATLSRNSNSTPPMRSAAAAPRCSRSSSTPPTRPPGPLVRAGSGLLATLSRNSNSTPPMRSAAAARVQIRV